MRYRDITEAGALAIATTIKAATWDIDRNAMVRLDKKWGLRSMTNMLVAAGFMTVKERKNAIRTLPKVDNPSLSYTS
jgi:hypothetical protein